VGKYGRVLGELFIKDNEDNEININETLIEEGHAYSYHGEKKKVYKNEK
jgi:endonuclease YncB( thermonuclease family)